MAFRTLVFSSDEKTVRALTEVLHHLKIGVESCSEIFAAVERVTMETFDLIIVDWEDELEAGFLLKSARELKANRNSLALAIVAGAGGAAVALQGGARLVLSKPVVPDDVVRALRDAQELMASSTAALEPTSASSAVPKPAELSQAQQEWFPGKQVDLDESPVAHAAPQEQEAVTSVAADVGPAAAGWSRRDFTPAPRLESFSNSPRPTIFAGYLSEAQPSPQTSERHGSRVGLAAVTCLAALAMVGWRLGFFSTGQQPQAVAPPPVVASSNPSESRSVDHTLQPRPDSPWDPDAPSNPGPVRLAAAPQIPASAGSDSQAEVKTTTFASVAESSVPNSEIKPERQRTVPPSASKALPIAIAVAEPSAQIPESLRNPSESTAIHAPVTKLAALALNKVLEPVLLTEEAARDLLVQQVLPAYPESALRAHVEGAVVLQAWVGKDGVIRDVKVIRGPLLLGRAAFEAVKQWRYKPYYLNGQAVEVLTMVTLRFRLPS